MVPDILAKIFSLFLLVPFVLMFGVSLAPFWLFMSIVGWLVGAIHYKEIPSTFWGLSTCKWFFED